MEHCDNYIDDESQPACLREFLAFARSPAHGSLLGTPKPPLYALYNGKVVRVTVASRLGDVGITTDLGQDYGYQERVAVEQLSDFSPTPSGKG